MRAYVCVINELLNPTLLRIPTLHLANFLYVLDFSVLLSGSSRSLLPTWCLSSCLCSHLFWSLPGILPSVPYSNSYRPIAFSCMVSNFMETFIVYQVLRPKNSKACSVVVSKAFDHVVPLTLWWPSLRTPGQRHLTVKEKRIWSCSTHRRLLTVSRMMAWCHNCLCSVFHTPSVPLAAWSSPPQAMETGHNFLSQMMVFFMLPSFHPVHFCSSLMHFTSHLQP